MPRTPASPRASRSTPVRILLVAGLSVLALAISRDPDAEHAIPRFAAAADITLQPLATGLSALTSIAHAGDARLFLTEQPGRIRIWNGAAILPASFLDLTAVVSCCGELGLLSVAFHPQYASNGFFFVNYTNAAGDTVVARYRVSVTDPNAADPSSRAVLLTIGQPFSNHNGGELQFGPDGYLYIGMGDGGSSNDPLCTGQRDDTLLGKLLRIDVDQNVDSPPYYGIPPSNPFPGPTGSPNEVWAKGLRNPWRFSFDRGTGDLYIGDVGQSAREEIDFEPRGSSGGRNYGWKIMEGTLCGAGGANACPAGVPPCGSPVFTGPIYEYGHDAGDCSVTGGYVYRGAAMSSFRGAYFYGDYCSGRIWANGQPLTPRPGLLTTFGEDASGELYLGAGGGFYRVAEAGVSPTPTSAPPSATPTPTRTATPTVPPPTATATLTPTRTPTAAPPSATPSVTPTPPPSPPPSATPTFTATPTSTSPPPSATPSVTPTPPPSPPPSPTPSFTPTAPPSPPPSVTPSFTATPTSTSPPPSATPSLTGTPTPTPSLTRTSTPASPPSSATPTLTRTRTPTPTPTAPPSIATETPAPGARMPPVRRTPARRPSPHAFGRPPA